PYQDLPKLELTGTLEIRVPSCKNRTYVLFYPGRLPWQSKSAEVAKFRLSLTRVMRFLSTSRENPIVPLTPPNWLMNSRQGLAGIAPRLRSYICWSSNRSYWNLTGSSGSIGTATKSRYGRAVRTAPRGRISHLR